MAAFILTQTIRTNRAIAPGFVLIEPNMTSVNTTLWKSCQGQVNVKQMMNRLKIHQYQNMSVSVWKPLGYTEWQSTFLSEMERGKVLSEQKWFWIFHIFCEI